jgi:hypothetical protein
MKTTPETLAGAALGSLEFYEPGALVSPPKEWERRSRSTTLVGRGVFEFQCVPGRHLMQVEARFGSAGALTDIFVRDPMFGRVLAQAATLPSGEAFFVSPERYSDVGLWLDQATGLVWTPGQFGKGEYTFDSAQRLPDRLAEGGGYKGFYDWRMPTLQEVEGMVGRVMAAGLHEEDAEMGGVWRPVRERGNTWLWTSTPAEDGAGSAYALGEKMPGFGAATNKEVPLPIVLVRDSAGDE